MQVIERRITVPGEGLGRQEQPNQAASEEAQARRHGKVTCAQVGVCCLWRNAASKPVSGWFVAPALALHSQSSANFVLMELAGPTLTVHCSCAGSCQPRGAA